MSSTGRSVSRYRSLISPLIATVVSLALMGALLAGVVVAAGNVITSPDTAGNVGSQSSLVLDASGNPVVSYRAFFSFSNSDLKILHCGDPNCTSGNTITSPDTSGIVGLSTSLALDATGNPVVSYYDAFNSDLKILHCGDPNCTSGNTITSPGAAGSGATSLALDSSGNPVVSYFNASLLSILHCGDPNCSSGNIITLPDEGGAYSSLALDGGGNPVVSHYDAINLDLKILHCGDPNCTSGNTITSPDTAGDVGTHTSLVLDSSGNPVVSYLGEGGLNVLHCGDSNCSSGNIVVSPDTAGLNPTSLVLDSSGNPVVSYRNGGDLKVLHCGDSNCSSGNIITSPDTTTVGEPSLALDGGGNPVVSYQSISDLKVLHCGDPNCSTPTPTPTPTPGIPSAEWTFVNDTGQVVNDLHVEVGLAGSVSLTANAPGCPVPSGTGGNLISSIDLVWSTTCVDQGESVTLEIFADCFPPLCGPPPVLSYYWTLNGTPVGTPTPTPVPTPTPLDSDGDGVPDASDACPFEAGSVVGGCPPVGGVVELAVRSGDSPVEHQTDPGREREVAALAVALAAVGVAGVYWQRYRRRAG